MAAQGRALKVRRFPRYSDRQTTILRTKLFVPRLPGHLVARPSLTDRIEAGSTKKLILVSAPAGFGKTTTLADWIDRSGRVAAWISLEPEDNDPLTYYSYMLGAIRTVHPEFGQDLLSLLRDANPPALRLLTAKLVNELAGEQEPLWIVLNDYHEIHLPMIQESMVYFIEHAPPHVHTILLTRKDPPWPLAKWRTQGELLEIRAADLKFKFQETTALINEKISLNLTPSQLRKLDQRTEGWAAGIQLAASSLQGIEDRDAFLDLFSGSDRNVFDYLVGEVIRKQPSTIRRFLLQTSIFNRMNSSLCQEVTGNSDAARILPWLEKSNLFLTGLDRQGNWYKYHDLFRSALHARLRSRHRETERDLHLKASRWFEREKLPEEAIYHALKAEDWSHALDLIMPVARGKLMQRQHQTVEGWLSQIPVSLIENTPELCLWHAIALILERQFDRAVHLLQIVAEAPDAKYRSSVTVTRALQSLMQGSMDCTELAQQALKAGHFIDPFFEGVARLVLGFSVVAQGDAGKAFGFLEDGYLIARKNGGAYGQLVSRANLAWAYLMHGRLRDAEKRLQELTDTDSTLFPEACMFVHSMLCEVKYEQNRLEEAKEDVKRAMTIEGETSRDGFFPLTYWRLSRALWVIGEPEEATRLLKNAMALAMKTRNPPLILQTQALQAEFHLWEGNQRHVTEWMEEWRPRLQPLYVFEPATLLCAKVLIREGRPQEALEILNAALKVSRAEKRGYSVARLKVLMALAEHTAGTTRALTHLEEALTLAEPESMMRTFLDEAPQIQELLGLVLKDRSKDWKTRNARLIRFVVQLQTALGATMPKSKKAAPDAQAMPAWYLPDPLSERELEVLGMVARGLSSEAIARKFNVATATIKRHLSNLYLKLDVHSRTEAVARAREFKLLD